MEAGNRKPGETPAQQFKRLEDERRVRAYFFIIPTQAKILGTIFEKGMLVRDSLFGKNPRIVCFFEEGFAEELEDGAIRFLKGKRTRYYEDVIEIAENVPKPWVSYEDLLDRVTKQAKLF